MNEEELEQVLGWIEKAELRPGARRIATEIAVNVANRGSAYEAAAWPGLLDALGKKLVDTEEKIEFCKRVTAEFPLRMPDPQFYRDLMAEEGVLERMKQGDTGPINDTCVEYGYDDYIRVCVIRTMKAVSYEKLEEQTFEEKVEYLVESYKTMACLKMIIWTETLKSKNDVYDDIRLLDLITVSRLKAIREENSKE